MTDSKVVCISKTHRDDMYKKLFMTIEFEIHTSVRIHILKAPGCDIL